MNKSDAIRILFIFFLSTKLLAQTDSAKIQDSFLFKGQLSIWSHYNENNTLPLWSGIRYIPQINYKINLKKNNLIDFEASANLFGNIGLEPFDSSNVDGKTKPYRFWARYSTEQFEFRAGLQKINFGSATLIRPLMWFDQIDPRDPLQLTDGVWAALARYYFLNNANLWFWALYGNKNLKGWEMIKTNENTAEFGGRFQSPVPGGEAGISYHHRIADSREFSIPEFQYANVPENRIGLDAKFDYVVGFWMEASWVNKGKDMGMYTNQELINLGVDYTFGIGNGLTLIFEQFLAAADKKAFEFGQTTTFSLLNLTYNIDLFDNINAIIYYDWVNNRIYNFVNWQKQFNKWAFYLMGYANPKDYNIPSIGATENLYAGWGVQVMVVFNH